MANSENAQSSIDMATAAGNLKEALVIGKSYSGGIEFFIVEADKERMIATLERARAAIIKSMDG